VAQDGRGNIENPTGKVPDRSAPSPLSAVAAGVRRPKADLCGYSESLAGSPSEGANVEHTKRIDNPARERLTPSAVGLAAVQGRCGLSGDRDPVAR
jgi:hypothetical protein